jgi:hypothetical protein
MLMRQEEACVLHVAAVQDPNALRVLSRTTQVIAAMGVGQVLLALDQGPAMDGTWAAALAVEVRPLRCAGLSLARRIRVLQAELSRLLRERTPCAVHLHGIVPFLVGPRALKGAAMHGRVLCSPNRMHFGPPWAAGLLGRLVQSQLARFDYAPIAASVMEAQVLSKLLNRAAEVLPPPVSEPFFAVARHESAQPSILAEGVGDEAVDVVTRLCVLLNGRHPRVQILWLGATGPRAAAQLAAATVALPDALDEARRAHALAHAWLYLEMSARDTPALGVAQAMAAGVPCLVSDVPGHRALIHHGETGFVCTSERDLVEKVVFLLRNRAERRRIGEAARAEAGRRFTERDYQRALLRAYGFASDTRRPEVRVLVAN